MTLPAVVTEREEYFFGSPALEALNPQRRDFVLQYVFGPLGIKGVAYKAYIAAGYMAKNNNVASAAAYQVLHDPTVESAIAEVRKEADRKYEMQLGSWMGLAVKARDLLEAHLETMQGLRQGDRALYLGTAGLQTIKEVLDRAIGRPTQKVEKDIGTRMDQLIRDLAAKRQPPGHRFVPPGHGLPPVRKPDILDATYVLADAETDAESDISVGGNPPGGTGMGRESEGG